MIIKSYGTRTLFGCCINGIRKPLLNEITLGMKFFTAFKFQLDLQLANQNQFDSFFLFLRHKKLKLEIPKEPHKSKLI